jgi:hypothetical protein
LYKLLTKFEGKLNHHYHHYDHCTQLSNLFSSLFIFPIFSSFQVLSLTPSHLLPPGAATTFSLKILPQELKPFLGDDVQPAFSSPKSPDDSASYWIDSKDNMSPSFGQRAQIAREQRLKEENTRDLPKSPTTGHAVAGNDDMHYKVVPHERTWAGHAGGIVEI